MLAQYMLILVNQEGQRFTLDANSILDISDLRKIQERELFLYLMTQKVDKLKIQEKSTKIRIGNVSVVHGNSKQEKAISESIAKIVETLPVQEVSDMKQAESMED